MTKSPFSLVNFLLKFFKVYFSSIFKVPTEAHCNLPEATTKIGKEVEVTIEQCNGSGCFEFPISYDVNMDQIRALISRSTKCTQLVEFSCFSSPIKVNVQKCLFWEILLDLDIMVLDGAPIFPIILLSPTFFMYT